jgi:hypothetical protein
VTRSARLSVALCPHPPLLFRELAGLQDPLTRVREACRDAVARLCAAGPTSVIVVGGAEDTSGWDASARPDVASFGVPGVKAQPVAGAARLPLSLGVGSRLLEESGWRGPVELRSLAWDAPDDTVTGVADALMDREGHTGVLLLGGGSACRDEKAPGFLDERAFPFDDRVASALVEGDASALRSLDVGLARELLVDGRSTLRLLGALFPDGPAVAELSCRDDALGVSYFVARWAA